MADPTTIPPELLKRLSTWFNPATTVDQKQALDSSQFASMWGPGGADGTESRSLYGDNGYFDKASNRTFFGGGGKMADAATGTPTAFSGYDITQPGAGAQGSSYQKYDTKGTYLGEGTFPKRSALVNFLNSDMAAALIFGGGILGAGALVGAGAGAAGLGAAETAISAPAATATADLTGGLGGLAPAGGYGISTLPELGVGSASFGASGLGLDAALEGVGAAGGAAGGAAAGGGGSGASSGSGTAATPASTPASTPAKSFLNSTLGKEAVRAAAGALITSALAPGGASAPPPANITPAQKLTMPDPVVNMEAARQASIINQLTRRRGRASTILTV